MARDLNKVLIIGNLTRDPEARQTAQGGNVTNFTIATNRQWNVDGEKREQVEFHTCVAWDKLATLCEQMLVKGSKVYVEGRLSNRKWKNQDGTEKEVTEIILSDMLLLDNNRDR